MTDCVEVRAALQEMDLVPRITRWWMIFQEYDMKMEYRPGRCM